MNCETSLNGMGSLTATTDRRAATAARVGAGGVGNAETLLRSLDREGLAGVRSPCFDEGPVAVEKLTANPDHLAFCQVRLEQILARVTVLTSNDRDVRLESRRKRAQYGVGRQSPGRSANLHVNWRACCVTRWAQ